MINAHRTGAFISELRKARDWTQLELAEKLQVTHQAVSQWEKGASFPDVGLLPPLARHLGVSVDDLLNGGPAPRTGRITRGVIVEELSRGHVGQVAQLVKNNPEGIDMMLQAAPLARPSQMNDIVANLAGFEFTLQQIIELAPFVGHDALQTLLDNAALQELDVSVLVELAPFVGADSLDRWTKQVTPGTLGLDELENLAPFLKQATLGEMLTSLLDADQPLDPRRLEEFAPFLGREQLEQLVRRMPDGPLAIDHVCELAPFVSPATLETLLARVADPAAIGEHLEDLAPFLDQASLKRAVSQLKGSLTTDALVELAPFLDKETLAGLLRDGPRG